MNNTRKQQGGYGDYGVKLDSTGNIDNDKFIAQVKRILKENDLSISSETSKIEKCLPDDEDEFQKTFIRESTNYSDLKDTSADLLKVNTLRRRIMGLTSYYRTANTDVLPKIIEDNGTFIFYQIDNINSKLPNLDDKKFAKQISTDSKIVNFINHAIE